MLQGLMEASPTIITLWDLSVKNALTQEFACFALDTVMEFVN